MTAEPTYHHGDLANALLDAVADIISERGLAGVSLREAARRAGVSHSAPAHHFGDKDGMLEAFATRGHEMLADRMLEGFVEVQDRSLREQLAAIGRKYFDFAVTHPAHYEAMFRRTIPVDEELELYSPKHLAADRTFSGVALLVNVMGQAGIIDPTKGRYVATLLWGFAHGIASMWLDGLLPHFYEDHTWDEFVEGVLDAMGSLVFGD